MASPFALCYLKLLLASSRLAQHPYEDSVDLLHLLHPAATNGLSLSQLLDANLPWSAVYTATDELAKLGVAPTRNLMATD